MKSVISILAILFAFAPLTSTAHQVINEFDCTLNPGHTVAEVFALKDEWMKESKKLGWTLEQYDAEILLPIFSSDTATNPQRLRWRGKFKDFATHGNVLQSFMKSGFEDKIRVLMNCRSAEQWFAPQG
jgi:hypothetical protein